MVAPYQWDLTSLTKIFQKEQVLFGGVFFVPHRVLARELVGGLMNGGCWDDIVLIVGFTRIAVNFKFHSWFANFKLT